jgi:ArsR family transcriptional regulator, arsenate/arsenite/antimonite-responsive transcriptional repressor
MTFSKKEHFDNEANEIALIAKALSHPARIAILKYLAKEKKCISGDITGEIPLSRTTVSQHLQELKKAGIIHGEIDGNKINYCLCGDTIEKITSIFERFLNEINFNIPCKNK